MNNDKATMFKPLTSDERRNDPPKSSRRKQEWKPLSIIPNNIKQPEPHYKHGEPSAIYEYRNIAGELLCFVCRFDLPVGGKEVLPVTFCEHSSTRKKELRWKGPLEPRPIYNAHFLKQYPDAPILLCEGEKAADAAAKLHPKIIAVSTLGGSNAAHKAHWGILAKRKIIIWPDADEPGMKYAEVAAKSLHLVSAEIRIVIPPQDVVEGWDAADALAEGWDEEKTISFLGNSKPVNEVFQNEEGRKRTGADTTARTGKKGGRDNNDETEDQGKRIPQRELVVELMEGIELWHDEDRKAFASIQVKDHWENWPIRSRDFRIWLTGLFYSVHQGVIGSQALEDGLKLMECQAIHDSPEYPTYLRVGGLEDRVYLDLGDKCWRVVEITKHSWKVIERAPVKFLRSNSMSALPEPELGETIERMRDIIPFVSEDDFKLIVAWLVGALRPEGPYPLLLINGQQGSAKSTISRFLRELIDPNRSPVRAQPKDEGDLMVSADNNRVLAFDNVSGVAPWLSDALCRIATGGGYAKRELHSDRGEIVLDAQRPMLLNGIPGLASRPDLGDRAIVIELPTIPSGGRKTEREVKRIFQEARPMILGALLDAVSMALRNIDTTNLENAPRMADFAEWVTAAEQGLGWEPGSFVPIFNKNRDNAIRLSIEDDPIIQAVIEIADEGARFKGNATALLQRINSYVSDSIKRTTYWPKTPAAMGTAMKRISPSLRIVGIYTERAKSGDRYWLIEKR